MIDIDVSEDREKEAAAEVCCDVSAVESENQDVNAEDKHEDLNVVKDVKPELLEPLKMVTYNDRYGNPPTYVSTQNERTSLTNNERSTIGADSY